MTTLRCPQPHDVSVISGFMTPGASRPGGQDLLAGSITVDIRDPTEAGESIRVVATDDFFSVEVAWCVCGPLASSMGGCWYVKVFIDDIDGVGPTHGLLGSVQVDVASMPVTEVDDISRRSYNHRFDIPGNTVGAGVYKLVVVITCASGSCERPEPLLRDMCGYAEVPVLVFYEA